MPLSVSVIVIADSHPQELQPCLRHLRNLRRAPDEIFVVESSSESRQTGIEATTGEIIVFIDATSQVEPTWLDEVLDPYRDDSVVGVSGRVLYGRDDGQDDLLGKIGCLLPNGSTTSNFGANPGRPVEVDHLPSANASFRRSAVGALGEVQSRYPGRSHREVTEISLRLKAAGATLIFQPSALVRAPALDHAPGLNRFSYRDCYFHHRDHIVVLVQALGWRSPLVPRFVWTKIRGLQTHVRRFVQHAGSRDPDGTPRSTRARLTSPVALLWIGAEISGLAAGFPAAIATGRGRLRSHRPARSPRASQEGSPSRP